MDSYKKLYKYLSINTLTSNIAHFNNYRDICSFINNNNNNDDDTTKLTIALISRRFKSNNHFTFDIFIIVKLLWDS